MPLLCIESLFDVIEQSSECCDRVRGVRRVGCDFADGSIYRGELVGR